MGLTKFNHWFSEVNGKDLALFIMETTAQLTSCPLTEQTGHVLRICRPAILFFSYITLS